jgi:diguanylate cyclase (GGDEF)-like protein
METTSALKKGIARFYVITLVVMSLGFFFGLSLNWEQQLEATKISLGHDAALTSTFIDNALISTTKSLDSAKEQVTAAIHSGSFDEAQAHRILSVAISDFMRFTASEVYGLLFFVDKQGQLFARSGEYPARPIDFSDRYYYQELRDHPKRIYAIGPIIKARTTGRYVFHMSVPVLDAHGAFYGALVQQLQIDDLCGLLGRNYHGLAEHIAMHHPTEGISFVYPAPTASNPLTGFEIVAQAINKSELKNGCILVDTGKIPLLDSLIVGFATSPTFGFVTSAAMGMKTVLRLFLAHSLWLLGYFFFSMVFVSYLFWTLYRQCTSLEMARFTARHDALTNVHNRCALNEDLPVLLHEAMRSQSPLSFLFIDIDHFKRINDTYNHDTGDAALHAVGKTLCSCRRPLDFLCRWGGEEFLVILPYTTEERAVAMANTMMEAVKNIKIADIHLTLSVGIKTTFITMESIFYNHISDAESAMMAAKKNGRAHYRIFEG